MHEPVPELWRTIHGSLPPQVLTWTEQWALAYVDAALTVTQQLKETYVGRGAEAAKISVILNVPETRFLGLDEDVVEADPEPAGEGVEHFTLISHGAIEERYGHDTMLEAVALVRSQIPGLRLRIMGRGSYQDEFVTLVGRMGLEDCVQYLGWVSLSQMVRELRASDAGIVAQKSSPYSNLVHTNKMYEFIALGKPVLASRLRAVEAYFGEDALCYFEPGDAESLAHGILDLYRHPAKRRTLVENAQALYNQYKWERQKDVYLSVYRALLG
jgi:glycosyltransferase involved in cell wall biosynthesis